ncbi:carbon-nitrogen hydrolase [Chlamydoabsidia padenii]|nr:carbon-nitrogen hydrolase [Chlamydoabsidia padenii]
MRIALVQFHIDYQNKQTNWARAESYMAQAAKQNVDLIVFPEFFLGGPGRKSTLINPTKRLSLLAQRYQMDLVPGTVIEQDEQGKYRNIAYYIDKSGQVLLKYIKVHLWQHEQKYLTQGNYTFGTVKNRFGIVVGLCTCWDLSVPEVFREMALNGNAQLVIVPAYWTVTELDNGDGQPTFDVEKELDLVNHVCASRAFENGICLAFCDAAERRDPTSPSTSPFGVLAAATRLAVPFKGIIAQSPGDHECLVIADLDIHAETTKAESLFKIRTEWKAGSIFTGNASKI